MPYNIGLKSDDYCQTDNNKMNISYSLRDLLLQARDQGRLIYGMYDSAKHMETDPDSVMLCILPESDLEDVTMHIHFTLIEAYCWENDIRLIKVDRTEKLVKLLGDKKAAVNDNDIAAGRALSTEDFSCITVRFPNATSDADEDVMHYYKQVCCDDPHPMIPLTV
ncbi:growth arrest and DNA damage-inducible protein GADD45 beta-like isoform X2 [Tubulanus polymorphus]|uniref:growth arrest and DNA damage-inducible protein GADD45 beta-like isoform X2 n=1 Tax=Tubulanus polymorphus TaxID=672921 RepID=UPI003DA472EE